MEISNAQVTRATRARMWWALFSAFLLLISVVFLVLVELGDTRVNGVLDGINFIKINVTDIDPQSVPSSESNSVTDTALSLGLHDYYTVGLWGYCEGFNNAGVMDCSKPKTLFWFNPVEILQSELRPGANITLPTKINQDLKTIRISSQWMFGLFLAGTAANTFSMLLSPLSVFSRWATVPIVIFTSLGALITTVAAALATALFVIMKNAFMSDVSLNIKASIGVEMFAFMWVGALMVILAWMIQMGQICCCTSRRDIKREFSDTRKRETIGGWSTDSS